MSDKEKPVTDQILDLLLEALEERQRAREAAPETAAPEMKAHPPIPDEAPAPPEPTDDVPFAPAEEDDPADEGEAPYAEPLPPVYLGRMLARLSLALVVLLLVINIPFNRYGTSLARAMPDSAALVIRDGLVLKGSGDEVYVLEDNKRRWITTLDAFEYYGYRWGQVHEVDDAFLNNFEEGRPIYLLLKCRTSPHVYALEDGKKRWIKDIPTFEANEFKWEDIQDTSCDYLRGLPDGTPIPEDAGPPPQP
ncbi:MAG: hypothetical protein ACE5E7_13620 [Anaerolineae bacterium]